MKKSLFAIFALLSGVVSAADQPNILWIFSEDLSPYMGCYGDPINAGHTPAIDQLAADGVLFTRTFMPAPVCSAARSAMITGVMQTTTGAHQHRSSRYTEGTVVPEELRINLPSGMKTIPELMRDAGYFTFNTGKDDYNFHYDRRQLYSVGSEEKYIAGMNGWQGNKARAKKKGSYVENTWNERPDKDQPWFGQIMIWGGKANSRHVREGEEIPADGVPLPPYFPDTPAYRKEWTQHYNAVRGADAQVEEILAMLEADGEMENTIVFFFSDHGNNQSIRHKQFCYEGGVHVPLMIKGNHPALEAGKVRTELVNGLDISATTLAFGGAEMPEYLDGQDLFASEYKTIDFVISARDRCDYTIDRIRTVRTEQFRYIRNFFPDRPLLQAQYRDQRPPVTEMKRMRDEGKLTPYQEQHWFGTRPEEELYEISEDPHQINNLADDPTFINELKRHRQMLNDWITKTDDRGQYPEAAVQLKATYDLWKDKPVFSEAEVNPEYDQFK
ncbi:MAG: sulfatase [Verrucomicrobiales bacterium]|nr:sulfatase [Verrucomicrobiales bacterium]